MKSLPPSKSIEQTAAHQGELELAHRTLEAEQQPIVRVAWVVDAVDVEHACADEAAQLQKMVPVASVACE